MKERRDFLKAAGAGLAAAALMTKPAEAARGKNRILYSHGMVWNLDLPGVLSELLLTFDVRVALRTGTGLGTFSDSLHPEFNGHFHIHTAELDGNTGVFEGEVVRANDPANVGLPIVLTAEFFGDATRATIDLGDLTFRGAGASGKFPPGQFPTGNSPAGKSDIGK